MKKRLKTLAVGLIAALAVSPVLADEPIDCFYEAHQSHALCQANIVAQAPTVPFVEPEYLVLQGPDDELIDCFYDANRMEAACFAVPEMIVMRMPAE